MPDNIIDLPHDFVAAFIDYAHARQIADTNFDPNIIDSPLDLSAGRQRISLSNGYPGCSPFLHITAHDGGHRVEIGAHHNSVAAVSPGRRTQPHDVIHGGRDVDLHYPLAAAIAAYDLWIAQS
jgi:hypothetical protein